MDTPIASRRAGWEGGRVQEGAARDALDFGRNRPEVRLPKVTRGIEINPNESGQALMTKVMAAKGNASQQCMTHE
ncbi:MAG: hypothetical protein EOP82_18840 [Variovorax sp.]|nr:MAG: hypothetical protein EOP82_18840 [Variovorax sp.]